ncbi:MAG: aminotransferase class V-fold PLP-dependent enzyme [Candidatus Aminicenantes bacterium]|jgi:selenocysteine lyase/cysteine desulfurase
MSKNNNCGQKIKNFPEDVRSLPRRQFMKGLFGGAAAVAVFPSAVFGDNKASLISLKEKAFKLSASDGGGEDFWKLVKENFSIRKGLIMLNAANLCPSPHSVQQRVFELTRDVDADPSSHNRKKFGDLREEARSALANFLGVSPEEIAIVRNTSEGNNMVINGLTFKPNDEVIIWDENHPTANIAWDIRAERYGFKVKRVKTPEIFDSDEELMQPFIDAMTERTKLLCYSHVSNISGIALPAEKMCAMARKNGILSHIDGAQTFGSHVVDLSEIGCDFYTGSSHKWFLGPKEVGILYVRKERIADLWPTIVGVGYPGVIEKGAQKFETLGQRDDSRIAAMETAVAFHKTIGKERIEARIRSLAAALKTRLKERMPKIKFRTPLNQNLSGGVVVFHIPGIDLNKVLDILYHKHNIGCAVFGGDPGGIRFCPHIYNTVEEIDKAVDAVAS